MIPVDKNLRAKQLNVLIASDKLYVGKKDKS